MTTIELLNAALAVDPISCFTAAGVPLVPAGDSVDRAELAKFPSESLQVVRSELDEVLGAAEKELPA